MSTKQRRLSKKHRFYSLVDTKENVVILNNNNYQELTSVISDLNSERKLLIDTVKKIFFTYSTIKEEKVNEIVKLRYNKQVKSTSNLSNIKL